MSEKVDFSIATSEQIEVVLGRKLESIRLARNMTQARLARASGISLRTVRRMEKGQGISLNTFIRVLMALGIQNNLQILLPDALIDDLLDQTGNRKIAKCQQHQINQSEGGLNPVGKDEMKKFTHLIHKKDLFL